MLPNSERVVAVSGHRRWLMLCGLVVLAMLASMRGEAQEVKPADRSAYQAALEKYKSKHYHEAAQQMRRVASRNPQVADPYFWLGMMAVKDGYNVAGIRRYFGKCIDIDPAYPHPLSHFYRALIYYTDNEYEKARQELNFYFNLAKGSQDVEVNKVYEEASNYLYWAQFLADAELNRVPYRPRKVQGVSSRHEELFPFLTVDGQAMYYLRQVPIKQAPTFYTRQTEQKQWMLYESRLSDTTFDRGKPMGKPFNSGLPEGGVSVTADGRELYYSVIKQVGGYANSDIYRVKYEGGCWHHPEALGTQVNGENTWESQPSVSADGKTLIFASNRKGGMGGIDLWKCRRLPNGDWSRAENMGSRINTSGNEKAPFLAADGHTLYFLSDGWQGFGGYDIYFLDINDKGGLRPTNLGLPVNTEGDELSFGVSADGRKAYIASKPEGAVSRDIYMFDLYSEAMPEPMRLVHFDVRDTAGNKVSGWETVVVPERGNCVVSIEVEGMFPSIMTLRAGFPSCQSIRLEPATVGSVHGLDLSEGLEERVTELAAWLIAHPRIHIRVECPQKGDALRVVEILKNKGIRAERLSVLSGSVVSLPQIRIQ